MSSKIQLGVVFVLGAIVGGAATRYYIKNKYEQLAQEEIDSVKQMFLKMFLKKAECEKKDISSEEATQTTDEIDDALNILRTNGYVQEDDTEESGGIYVISPEEFGNRSDYDSISFTYYANGVLADEYDEIVPDVENTIGIDSVNHFDEYEEDSGFVRNDIKKCDYEILLDESNYTGVIKNS